MSKSTFLDAANKTNTSHIPVWFMRQAGRYLPEYMEVKKNSSFRKMSHTPELMAEITLQPLRRFNLDAAIMFSDILTCLEYMGSTFEFTDQGPRLETAGPEALTALTGLNPEKDLHYVREGIQRIKTELTNKPVIGFVGAPFTLASYLVEGGTSKDFQATRRFMLNEPKKFKDGLNHLGKEVGQYLKFQIESGVSAVQIFDSWGGTLGVDDYREYVLPSLKTLISQIRDLNTPIILYSQPTVHLLPALVELDVDVLSVDWRTSMEQYALYLSHITEKKFALQGNLDPTIVTLPWDEAKKHVDNVLNSAKKAEILDRYIFNVGHGVTPSTRPETVGAIVDYVHEFK